MMGCGLWRRSSLGRRSPGLLFCKAHAQRRADCGDACEENYKCRLASARNFSDSEQDVTGDKINQRQQNVHGWRGQPLSGRVRERCWKAVTRNAMHEMRHDIREKHSGEETNDVVIPVHCAFSLR